MSPEIRQRFAALQRQFVVGLAARWQSIGQAPDAQARQQALHRLAGGAGSYGLPALSQLARQAERLATDQDAAALAQALAALQTELAAELSRCNSQP